MNQMNLLGEKNSSLKPDHSVRQKAPLAERMRPATLDHFFGQEDLLGPNAPLRKAILEDQVHSIILWGPPGTGKTTLAHLIAQYTNREFVTLSAVSSGVKDIKEVAFEASRRLSAQNKQTILFVDEIHRFNKSQQDALLPHVENGTVILIGATTENPSFEINSALLSRAPVFVLKALSTEEIKKILHRGMVFLNFEESMSEEVLDQIVALASGDGRKALTLLERVSSYLNSSKIKPKDLNLELFRKAVGAQTLKYDSSGEEHYNTISAFIKSLRDSDPDAALHYLARMLESGEDPLFIVRRLVIFASEDIGNADPRALQVAIAVKDAVDFVGMPEARISLGQAVTYLACAPKSNASYVAVDLALEDVRTLGTSSVGMEIPFQIRNAPTRLMKNLGYGKGYRYAHDQPEESGFMTNLPEKLKNKIYYKPNQAGLEKQISEKLEYLRQRRKK